MLLSELDEVQEALTQSQADAESILTHNNAEVVASQEEAAAAVRQRDEVRGDAEIAEQTLGTAQDEHRQAMAEAAAAHAAALAAESA